MAALYVRANTVIGITGTGWNNTASAVDGSYGALNASYAWWTSAVSSDIATIDLGFGTQISSVIPANAVVTDLMMGFRTYTTNVSMHFAPTLQLYDGTAAVGPAQGSGNSVAVFTVMLRANVGNIGYNMVLPTTAQIRSSTFKGRIQFARGVGTTSTTSYLDFFDMAIYYVNYPVSDPVVTGGYTTSTIVGAP